MITTEQVKELRDKTSVSVMQCRKALEEASGDMDKAMILLQKKGSEIAAKKSDRDASDGLIVSRAEGGRAILLTLNCETDFVAHNEGFVDIAHKLLDIAWTDGKEAAFAAAPELINAIVLKIGENIKLGSIEEINAEVVGVYTHHTGKTATVVELVGGNTEVAKDIAMHATAMKPKYLSSSEITPEIKASVVDVVMEEINKSDKPEEIKQKMLEGKLNSFFQEQTLLDQSFFKIPEKTIAQYAAAHGATVKKFKTYTI